MNTHPTCELGRRDLFRLSAVAGIAVTVGGPATAGFAAPPTGGGGATPTAHLNPLHIPPVLSTQGPSTLTAGRTKINLGGKDGSALTYDGHFPGPTFVARTGTTASIRVTNSLTEETTVHWHGLVVPTAVDGQPHDAFGVNQSFQYDLPIRQRAGLSFYHPHPHRATAKQVALGLQGAFIVRDAEEDALLLPSGDYEVPLVIRDANLDKMNTLTYNGRASGFLGNTALVNGTLAPYLVVDRAVYRFRVVNAANSRLFRLALSNGASMSLIGTDGGLLPTAVAVSEVLLANAERLDLLVDLRGLTAPLFVVDRDSGWSLLELRPKPAAVTVPFTPPPSQLSVITPLRDPVRSRTFTFDGMTKVNGLEYDMNRISFETPSGVVEKWTFVGNGNPPHPIHVHGASFQVVARRGGRNRLFAWEGGWKDTVLLLDKESVDVLVRFDLKGRYLMHCHKLEHEDAGMMLNFQVV
ncbi:multicopper oxidase domain-containing protein [Knoellia locipacati]|uniref:multicopper oxidase family protein n=1 Tax=Knoellia locipacati TaxID=882824 RepID=UPI003851311A